MYHPTLAETASQGVAIESYSPLKPLTTYPGGPLDKPVNAIAKRLNIKPEEVHLAWVKSKGAIALTTSRTKERLEAYVAAGDVELTHDDIKALEKAGAKGPQHKRRIALNVLIGTLMQIGIYCLMEKYAK